MALFFPTINFIPQVRSLLGFVLSLKCIVFRQTDVGRNCKKNKQNMKQQHEKHIIDPEILAQVFLRLNGFFSLTNFIIHREAEYEYRVGTDIDICGIRFPYRREILYNPVTDDERLQSLSRPILVLGEVKTSVCSINESWLREGSDILKRAIATTGIFSEPKIDSIVSSLRSRGRYSEADFIVQIVCFGECEVQIFRVQNNDIPLPDVIQITWDYILEFIYRRFRGFSREKRDHPQWEQIGQILWKLAYNIPDYRQFRDKIIVGTDESPIVRDYKEQSRLKEEQIENINTSNNNVISLYLEKIRNTKVKPVRITSFISDLRHQMKVTIDREEIIAYANHSNQIEIQSDDRIKYRF